ncbi:L-fucose isomerase [Klebsiella pneumoniae]|uniref:L-fucose isomerase n=1 Tax=Klebsiella pneumoniae TaxID=573 RepID=A0A377XDM3_KLEPN|nr:L-fucose isomerase [Klebsiella pneumoniae]
MKKISLPKIGIRPVIDGRRMGIRESLEAQTMNMAKATAALISEKLRHACGARVECVIADTCIAGMAESAACEEKFSNQNVGVTITVTPCWCYGSETIDMDPLRPKAIWGFNGTERPGAVYLAAALAAHSQKGIPAFSIYGHDVQDADDTSIPADVEEKLLRFARAGLAVASMKGKSYLSLGGVSMGIAGSIVDHNFFESWLGMKVQAVDMTELRRRIDQKIYDETELEMALAWADKHFRYGEDQNAEQYKRNETQSRAVLKESLLMAMCIRDMMQGNPKLAEKGLVEESLGYNAIAAGFQGQRHWTDQYPNGDTAEALLNSSFDWNGVREPFVVATENDSLNGVAMLMGHQLTGTAQVFADVRTYWSPAAVERVTGQPLTGRAEHGIIHLINSGSAALDGSCQQRDAQGNPTMKPHWEIEQSEADACLAATEWCPAIHEYFRGGGFSSRFLTEGGRAVHHDPGEHHQRSGAGAANCRRLERSAAQSDARPARRPHQLHLAHHLVCPTPDRQGPVQRCVLGDGQLGRQPRRADHRPRWRRFHYPRRHAAHSGLHAQRGRGENLSPFRLGRARHGYRGPGLPRLPELRAAV